MKLIPNKSQSHAISSTNDGSSIRY